VLPKPSIILISRLSLHGAVLRKLLCEYYNVIWIGETFPTKITLFNVLYFFSLEFWKMLVNFKKFRFSLVLVQFVSLDAIVAVLFKRIFKTKFVLFAIGSDIIKIREHTLAYPILKFAISESDFVFCASGLIETKLREIGFKASKLMVVASAVDFDDFEPYYGPKMYDVASVGSLDSNKNPLLLLKACELMPSAKILLIGDGPLKDVLRSEIKKRNLKVTLSGEIPHKEVFRCLQKSRVYVQTSQSEGLPVSVLEAMFSGLPITLVEAPYVYDLKNRYGFVFHVVKGSIEALANELSQVLQNYEVESLTALSNKARIVKLLARNPVVIKEKIDNILSLRH